MQEDFQVHNEKNLAVQKKQQQRQLLKKEKKEQTPTRRFARVRGEKAPENKDNKVEVPRLAPEHNARKKKKIEDGGR
jgi:hypothetical protein